MVPIPENYQEKVYAGWLGKCIGVRFGAPIENWTYHQIQDFIGEIDSYLPIAEGKIFQPDDDTSVPLIFLRAIEDYGENVSAEQMGKTLLNYLGDQHGSLWWGGYGQSTEHTAYLNLKNGIAAPQSGSAMMNGFTVAEQIGGQIFSDIWGLLFPGDEQQAAAYAKKAASVTHDRNGIYGGMFIAAMVSAAFSSSQPLHWIQAGLSVIPADCEYTRVVQAIVDFYQSNPADWRACYEYIYKNFGYNRYPGIVHIIPNAAVIMMGLLYGEGDFSRSICITNMAGWDTDCNVGNVGCVVATAVGLAGIEQRWRAPQNDTFVAASVIGSANIVDIPDVVERIVTINQKLNSAAGTKKKPKCHFSLPGSTRGFRYWGEQRNILLMRQSTLNDQGALRCTVRLLKKKQEMGIYLHTYLTPEQLSSNYYGAGFSPTIYPGQKITARLYLPEGQPDQIYAALYVFDNHSGKMIKGGALHLLPGKSQEVEWVIPAIPNACLSQVGLVLRNMSPETWKGEFYLEELDWGGRPNLEMNLADWPMQVGSAAQWTYLRGFWRSESDGLHASGTETNESYTGLLDWDDMHIESRLKPILGDTHLVLFRVQGALRAYAAGVSDNKLVLFKKSDGLYRELISTSCSMKLEASMRLTIDGSGNHISIALPDEELSLQWTDEDEPNLTGMIGLANFANCHTCFEVVHVR
ncbi:MAG: ADP-ribosylglycohydrolase family protein [Anaerolineaceae bacterium]|nr:ADP-ribosylglycohydrolase family protein [Anaerolineaceae bacterium]